MKVAEPTIWGLSTAQMHDRFWASRGVQVVRPGEPSQLMKGAELFLLVDARSLALFDLVKLIDVLCWTKPELLCVRLKDRREGGYRERALVSGDNQFVGFERIYGAADSRLARAGLTRHHELALVWQSAPGALEGWRRLRRRVSRNHRHVMSVAGGVYQRESQQDLAEFARRLVKVWNRPDATVNRVSRRILGVWTDPESRVGRSTQFVGPVWVGAGRRIEDGCTVVGPSILWDDPAYRPSVEGLRWDQIEPSQVPERSPRPRPRSSFRRACKRTFDVAFALGALLLTAPIYPLVMLAIWLEDGRPFFFVHRRETVGGREFPCVKFRSMRKDAEKLKEQLAATNQADGPQFFIEHDPRLTRVGSFIRKCNIDELPQFVNVLLGHMSVVGPRPSPCRENQYCPPWREARLSVRPGITGLWQVKRTRRLGLDFQEWIKYDIEYVETANWRLDLWILWRTLLVVLAPSVRGLEESRSPR